MSYGVYLNSEKKLSFHMSKTFDLGKDYELEIGAVTGYDHFGPVMPMARVKKNNFFVAPVMEKWDGENNLGLVVGYEF